MDAKLEGVSIVRKTDCRVGLHVFVHTGLDKEPPPYHRCSCEAYSWTEAQMQWGGKKEA